MRPRRTVRFLCYAAAVFALAGGARNGCAQQAPPPADREQPADDVATLRVTTRTVEIATVVRDRAGNPQTALTQDAFALKVDGKEQPIQHFATASDLPLTLALVVDVSESQRTFITDEWRASDIFFQSMLTRPQDRATLIQVDARVLMLMNLTNSANRLHLALTQLGANAANANATVLNDAVFVVSKNVLAKERGRKAIVLLTDGGENASRAKLSDAIEQAQRANISIYAIDYTAWTGPDTIGRSLARPGYGLSDPGETELKKLTESTGGHVYTVSHSTPLERIFSMIETDLRNEYELGYNPPPDLKPNSFHKLEVHVKEKQFLVQARNGFYVQP